MHGVRGGSERPGELRTSQNFIGHAADTVRTARFVPPPPSALASLLDDLERYLNDDPSAGSPLLVRLAVAHYQFETIHPFRDGNGRVGRLLIPLMLTQHKKLDPPTLYLSAYFEKHRSDYVDLMLRVGQRGEWLAWIEFFLDAVAESAREACGRATKLLALRDQYHARLHKARSPALLLKLADSLFVVPSTTIQRTTELLCVTKATASANIGKLVDAGILQEVTGRKKNQRFLAPEILRFLDDGS
jgi:Fic family protein